MVKRQEEEAEVVAATQKRKMLCKTRRGNLVITVCRSLSQLHLQPETKFSRLVTMGDHSPEPVMRPCQVIHFIVRTSKKYILFVLFSYVFKS